MTLETWQAQQNLSDGAAAERLGLSLHTFRKYRAGQRVPRPSVMRAIYEATGRQVDANAFVGLSA
jgi:transcriptional regulator with XRE-family HTH domain